MIKTIPELRKKRGIKGIVVELNGPTHYYMPDQTEMTLKSKKRISQIEKAGYKVFNFHHLENENDQLSFTQRIDEVADLAKKIVTRLG